MPEKQLENIQCVPSAEMQESSIREESLTFSLPTFWFKVSKDVKSCNSGDQKKHSMYNVAMYCNKKTLAKLYVKNLDFCVIKQQNYEMYNGKKG
jgi:hypothetical protein